MELTGFSVNYESPVCKMSICMGCRQLDECADAIKYIRNTLKDRLTGKISHLELIDENNKRFGIQSKQYIIHWKELIGDQRDIITALVKMHPEARIKSIDKMSDNAKETFSERLKTLNYYGWFNPYLDNGELKFMTIHRFEDQKPELHIVDDDEGGYL